MAGRIAGRIWGSLNSLVMGREGIILRLKQGEAEKLRSYYKKIQSEVHTGIGRLISETVVNVHRDTVSPASFPVVTGSLRASYTFESDETKGAVYSDLDYAPGIEDTQPHLYPALKSNERRFYKAVDKLLQKAKR